MRELYFSAQVIGILPKHPCVPEILPEKFYGFGVYKIIYSVKDAFTNSHSPFQDCCAKLLDQSVLHFRILPRSRPKGMPFRLLALATLGPVVLHNTAVIHDALQWRHPPCYHLYIFNPPILCQPAFSLHTETQKEHSRETTHCLPHRRNASRVLSLAHLQLFRRNGRPTIDRSLRPFWLVDPTFLTFSRSYERGKSHARIKCQETNAFGGRRLLRIRS